MKIILAIAILGMVGMFTIPNGMLPSIIAQPASDVSNGFAGMLESTQPQAEGNETQVPDVYIIVCPPGWTDPAECEVIRIL
jgi:hypothetical protein